MANSGKNKNQRRNTGVLSDHRKVGTKFIPPTRQLLPSLREVPWVDRILPELVWLTILNDRLGIHRGTEVGAQAAKLADAIFQSEIPANFAFVSSFSLLKLEQ